MNEQDDERSLGRSLAMGVGALVVASLVIGGIIGAVTLGAVQFTGVTDEPGPRAEPTLYIPTASPSPSPSETGSDRQAGNAGNGNVDKTDNAQQQQKKQKQQAKKNKKNKKKQAQAKRISLSASPLSVQEMQRIDLTGTYRGNEGAALQVQRFEGGWTDFPVSPATVRGGTFSTYVMTGRSGTNRFRVVDTGSGKTSNPVRVRVG